MSGITSGLCHGHLKGECVEIQQAMTRYLFVPFLILGYRIKTCFFF